MTCDRISHLSLLCSMPYLILFPLFRRCLYPIAAMYPYSLYILQILNCRILQWPSLVRLTQKMNRYRHYNHRKLNNHLPLFRRGESATRVVNLHLSISLLGKNFYNSLLEFIFLLFLPAWIIHFFMPNNLYFHTPLGALVMLIEGDYILYCYSKNSMTFWGN